jgi:hypothetical protein
MHKLIIILVFIVVNLTVYSQQNTKNPFSSLGFGEEDNTQNATFEGLGNNRTALVDSTVLNIYNPASYSFLSHGQPIFSIGLNYNQYQFSQNSVNGFNNALSLNHMAFGLSFANRFGFSFGIKPFSNTGYDMLTSSWNGIDTLHSKLTGNGTISNAFAGFSIKLLNTNIHKFSIGLNYGRIFGSNFHNQTIYLQNESIASIKQDELKITSFLPELSAIYNIHFSKSTNLYLSSVYFLKNKLDASQTTSLIAASDYKNVNTFDTLNYTFNQGAITIPSSLEFAAKFDFTNYISHSTIKIPQVVFLASVKSTNWKEYQSSFNNTTFLNTIAYNFGIQFAPHVDFYDRSKAISTLSRIRYRIGYQYNQLPYQSSNRQYVKQAYSFGFGIPILSQRTLSSLNFAFSYSINSNSISTDFIQKTLGYSIGVTISPAFYDRWFRKNKID